MAIFSFVFLVLIIVQVTFFFSILDSTLPVPNSSFLFPEVPAPYPVPRKYYGESQGRESVSVSFGIYD